MAKYDQGGGCPCGLQRECDCSYSRNALDTSKCDVVSFAAAGAVKPVEISTVVSETWGSAGGGGATSTIHINTPKDDFPYKYAEGQIIRDFKAYVDKTYSQHYKTEEQSIECFDAWIAMGDSTPTFRNTAMKYLWRYGKKHGNNKDDLMKALHYVMMCLYVDHYKDKE